MLTVLEWLRWAIDFTWLIELQSFDTSQWPSFVTLVNQVHCWPGEYAIIQWGTGSLEEASQLAVEAYRCIAGVQ